MDQFQKRIAAAKRAYPSWNPAVGEYITGRMIEIRSIEIFNSTRKILDILDDKDHKEKSVWLGRVLLEKLGKYNPKPGDRIGIKFLGKIRKYKDYMFMVDSASEDEEPEKKIT